MHGKQVLLESYRLDAVMLANDDHNAVERLYGGSTAAEGRLEARVLTAAED